MTDVSVLKLAFRILLGSGDREVASVEELLQNGFCSDPTRSYETRHLRVLRGEFRSVVAGHFGIVPATRVHDPGQVNAGSDHIVCSADAGRGT